MSKLISLTEWAAQVYGESSPGIDTLRRWARESKISPLPKKHGRTYFVDPNAQYVHPYRLADRIHVAQTKKCA